MKDRRAIALLVVLGIAGGGYFGWEWINTNFIEGPAQARLANQEKLVKDIKKLKDDKVKLEDLMARLDAWKSQSLPANTERARSLYRSWLFKLATDSGLRSPNVETGSNTNRQGLLQVFNFTVRAKGDLSSLTRFLIGFYQANQLHQLQTLSITPVGRTGELDLAFAMQAVALKDSPQKDQLPTGTAERLAQKNPEDYRIVARRNLFAAGGASDPADRTVLTAVTSVDGKPEVWFTQQTEDKLYKFHPGDAVDFGRFRGKLVEVLPEDVVLESSAGDQWLLSIGENLGEALPLPPER
ncbi:MAG: hypothetical protein U0903_10805 [Planctomycetales bacterium]